MKNLILILSAFILFSCGENQPKTESFAAALTFKAIYVAPNGSDNNTGTINAPVQSLNKAWSLVGNGDTVYLREGKFIYTVQQDLSGKDFVKVFAYKNEKPVITRGTTFKKGNRFNKGMVLFTGSNCHWKGIRFTGMYTSDNNVDAGLYIFGNCNSNLFELIESDNNVSGVFLEGNYTGNRFLNSSFHDNFSNYDNSRGGNSDGLAMGNNNNKDAVNYIEGCKAYNNGDDGFDTFENSGFVNINNNQAYHNGYEYGTSTAAGNGVGIKLGSDFRLLQPNVLRRSVKNNLVYDNRNTGIHINEATYSTEIINNTIYGNKVQGVNFHYNNSVHTFKNNLIANNGSWDAAVNNNVKGDSNYISNQPDNAHNGFTVLANFNSYFISIIPGSPDFLKVKPGSVLTGKGYTYGNVVIVPPPPIEPPAEVIPPYILKFTMHIYSDGTSSTAKSINAKKKHLGDLLLYNNTQKDSVVFR